MRERRPPSPPARSIPAVALLALALGGCDAVERPASDSIRVLLLDDILTLDPNRELEVVTDSVLVNVFEPLVDLDDDLRVRTLLAQSWEHPTPERWRFRLRPGVRFHDGTALTSELVRDAILAVQRSAQHESSQFLGQIREVATPEPLTVDIVTSQPRAILPSLPLVYISKPSETDGSLVGTGPYKLREWRPGQAVVMERWDGYWGQRPQVREASFVPEPEPRARVDRLGRGEAQVAYGISPQAASSPLPGVRFERRPGLGVFYLVFDVRGRRGNPFWDARVRRAFHLAVDRERIVAHALRGTGAVATQPVARPVFGYNPRLPPARRDPAAARALLAEAGFPDGLRTRLDLSSARMDVGELLRDALRDAGVELELNALAGETVFRVAAAGTSPLLLMGWDCSSGEAGEFYEFCLHTPGGRYGRGNYGGYSNPAMDEIAERHAAVLETRARRDLLEQAAALAMEELPVLPLYTDDAIVGVREGTRVRLRADGQVRIADIQLEAP